MIRLTRHIKSNSVTPNLVNDEDKIEVTSLPEHPFHLVDPSPWPAFSSLGALTTTMGAVMYFHGYVGGGAMLSTGLLTIIYAMFVWWRDVVTESTYRCLHTAKGQEGLRWGMLLFIVSEIMFFFAFFWAFFHSSISPGVEIGGVWPPKGIEVLSPWEVPLLNTLILLMSGAAVTWAHHAILSGNNKEGLYGLILTIALAALFTGFQVLEYLEAPFSISDGIYGSTFFMATGFHGFHVFVGTLFLTVCLIRQVFSEFTPTHHFGFEAAAWYWHFVDVVWLFLFISIYWWGGY